MLFFQTRQPTGSYSKWHEFRGAYANKHGMVLVLSMCGEVIDDPERVKLSDSYSRLCGRCSYVRIRVRNRLDVTEEFVRHNLG